MYYLILVDHGGESVKDLSLKVRHFIIVRLVRHGWGGATRNGLETLPYSETGCSTH